MQLKNLLLEAIGLIRPLAADRRIKLHLAPLADESWHVMADYQRLKQVLLNILGNAVKYNRDGGSVTVSCVNGSGDVIEIRVTDTGSGVAPEDMERLFTPFERLTARHSEIEGTGLGLAVSKRLIEAMGGRIGVESTRGLGSTFSVTLAPALPPERRAARIENHAEIPIVARRTILYVEDNLANLAFIEDLLSDRPDLKLMTAMQGRVGVDLALQHKPDLMLLDLHLPDIPGWEVSRSCAAMKRPEACPSSR